MSAKRRVSKKELNEQYLDQWGFLRKSCEAYDRGDESEAKRIATTLRLLLHDSAGSHSLLGLLGRLDVLFFDTAQDVMPANMVPTFGLVLIQMMGGTVRFVPPTADGPPRSTWLIPFEHWWKKGVVTIPGQFALTRRDLVLLMTNQDGGAHVDPEIDERYYRLTRENAMGYTVNVSGIIAPIRNIEAASIRQIAHEVLLSLVRPHRVIPADLPESAPQFITSIIKDARTGETRQELVQVRALCMCKSGLPYRQCHARGGRNEGRRTEPAAAQ